MKKLLFMAAITLASYGQAQTALNVATGSQGGTYSSMFSDLGKVCTSASWLKEKKTTGSIDNIDLLLTNQVSMAFVQLDVLKAKQQIDKDPRVEEIKVLIPMSTEEVHVFVKNDSKIASFEKLGPYKTGIMGRTTSLHTVGAWGGSYITARVLSSMSKVNYRVVNFNSREEAFNSLKGGKIDAVIAVVGQPAQWVKEMSGVKLIPINSVQNLATLYDKAVLFYPQLSPTAVNTVSIRSALVTRDYKSADKKKLLLNYRKCATEKLTTLKETEGMHPKWSDVKLNSNLWPAYK